MSTATVRNRTREFFVWALAVAGGGIVLAVIVRLIPSEVLHDAGIMFLPLLVPVVVALAVVSIVFGIIALVRRRGRTASPLAPVLIPLIGSILIIVLIPVLVIAAQLLVLLAGQLVDG